MTAQNLDGMADLEAKLAFVTNEKNEMQEEFDLMRQTKQTEIVNLKEQVNEFEEKYNEARHDQVQVPILMKKLEDYKLLKERNRTLE